MIPDTDQIVDRRAENFCEEFAPRLDLPSKPTADPNSVAKRLFNEEAPPKRSFEDLF